MTSLPSNDPSSALRNQLNHLLDQLPDLKNGALIQQVLASTLHLANGEIDRLDWKILSAALQDMAGGFQVFYPYRHTRKISIFGSARIQPDSPEYQLAADFARCVTAQGFMVITGAGGGIMQGANEGAGTERSFGLNIRLPFEQGANPYIQGDPKLIDFKYFFTRKLFFLKESDALALFPGGFGTHDEAFECLTLCQTGKSQPLPLVLVDKPGGDYWLEWDAYIQKHLLKRGLISPDDRSLYTLTDRVDVACEAIASFYRVYHSCRYVGPKLVLRLNFELSDLEVEQLNALFSDILVKGQIIKSRALPEEGKDETLDLPRLLLYFNQRDQGRLYQMIAAINEMGPPPEAAHPERK
ncbi:LOG family protein [Leptolyngbya sp. FACHB-261]|uniref:LOG family protein n=1 Tax=Leptolyngbya sp. FACHB-261 TaxID=2692806 RepID=UPI001685341B|nr:LOG family protein [Leptolyngbya sp. FACHB-261]MBD2105106.1 LOG family protein [Leptolyngbya sp. FACHB-261]